MKFILAFANLFVISLYSLITAQEIMKYHENETLWFSGVILVGAITTACTVTYLLLND